MSTGIQDTVVYDKNWGLFSGCLICGLHVWVLFPGMVRIYFLCHYVSAVEAEILTGEMSQV
jgi:hypothetical protein